MASSISKEERKSFEEFLTKHPILEERDPDLFVDRLDDPAYEFEQSCSRMTRALLEGKL